MDQELEKRLVRLETKHRQWKRNTLFFAFLGLITIASLSFRSGNRFELIRTKGIIVEDAQGRDRILIGSPIPQSKDRLRTDTTRVRKEWAKQMENPEEYMRWYNDYSHSANGIVILNEEGFDRVQLGDHLSDANTGKRQFQVAGIVWNDSRGWEKGGAGVNTLDDGRSRAVMGLDDSNGEAIHLVSLEDGTKGLVVGDSRGYLLIGMSPKNGQWFQNELPFTGVKYFGSDGGLQWEQSMDQQ